MAVIEWVGTKCFDIGSADILGIPSSSSTYDGYLDAVEAHDVELFMV